MSDSYHGLAAQQKYTAELEASRITDSKSKNERNDVLGSLQKELSVAQKSRALLEAQVQQLKEQKTLKQEERNSNGFTFPAHERSNSAHLTKQLIQNHQIFM